MQFPKPSLLLASSFLLVISSYIPLGMVFQGRGGGSLFDILSVPLLVYFSILFIKQKIYVLGPSSALLCLSAVFALMSMLTKTSASNFFISFGVLFRFLTFISILLSLKSDFLLHKLKCVFYKFPLPRLIFYICCFYCFNFVLSAYSYVNGSWRFGFPFYSDGIDPHVWGPSLSFTLIFLCSIFSNINSIPYFPVFTKYLLVVTIFSCLTLSVLSSSRGSLLVLVTTFAIYYFFDFFKRLSRYSSLNIVNSRLIGMIGPLSFISIFAMLIILLFNNFLDLSSFRWDHVTFVFTRTFDVADIFQGTDTSRSDAINRTFDYLFSGFLPISKIFGGNEIISVSDSGIIFTIENYGFLAAFCLLCSISMTVITSHRNNATYILLVLPLLCLSIVASESYILPRLILFSLPAMILSRYIAKTSQRLI